MDMSISAIDSGMGGYSQAMFAAAAQAAAQVGSSGSGTNGQQAGTSQVLEAVQVAVLQKALENERSMVNILA